jgi:hypothetical protein
MREEGGPIAFLEAWGAGEIEHPGGTLLAHLRRTGDRLASWGAPSPLVLAGLCHAAYGTDGFPIVLIAPSRRCDLVAVIGAAAEAIVYFYASCDRGAFLPQLGRRHPPRFRDRFTNTELTPPPEMLRQFVELTFANELDLVLHSPEFARRHGGGLAELCGRCRAFATDAANAAARAILGEPQA